MNAQYAKERVESMTFIHDGGHCKVEVDIVDEGNVEKEEDIRLTITYECLFTHRKFVLTVCHPGGEDFYEEKFEIEVGKEKENNLPLEAGEYWRCLFFDALEVDEA